MSLIEYRYQKIEYQDLLNRPIVFEKINNYRKGILDKRIKNRLKRKKKNKIKK